MWTQFRKDIAHLQKSLNISDENFQPVNLSEWLEIENKIYNIFCKVDHTLKKPYWLWEYFKLNEYALSFNYNYPFDQLTKLIEPTEKVWLIFNESDKFWSYEGYIHPIVQILMETIYTDEV